MAKQANTIVGGAPMLRQLQKDSFVNGALAGAKATAKKDTGKQRAAFMSGAYSGAKAATENMAAQKVKKQLAKPTATKTATPRNNRAYSGTSNKAQVQMQSRANTATATKSIKKGK